MAQCCTECGSSRLTEGVACLNLRPLVYLVLIGVGLLLLPVVVYGFGSGLSAGYGFFLREVFAKLLDLAVLSLLAAWLLGPRVGKAIADVWWGAFNLILQAIAALARGLARLFRN